jgi:integrase
MIARKETGIRRNGAGWQAYIRVDGVLLVKQFPYETPLEIMRAWREAQKKPGRVGAGSLAADVATFLAKPEIAAQKYKHQIARYLDLWLEALGGDRARATVTRDELEAVIQGWLAAGLAGPTVYHRRSALVRLYNVLDGPGAANLVEATTCPKHWIPADHSIPADTLETILAAMPAARFVKKGITAPSIARLVAHVIATVGIRPVDLHQIRRHDIRWESRALKWPASEKGHGVPARWIPFTARGEAALRAFDAADAYGKFSPSAVSHSFKRAARRVDGDTTPIHLYGGRHTQGKTVYAETGDLATVGRLLGHAKNSRATAQYAQGADEAVNRKAIAALDAADAKRTPPARQAPATVDANTAAKRRAAATHTRAIRAVAGSR